jgi:hypothetical protein
MYANYIVDRILRFKTVTGWNRKHIFTAATAREVLYVVIVGMTKIRRIWALDKISDIVKTIILSKNLIRKKHLTVYDKSMFMLNKFNISLT